MERFDYILLGPAQFPGPQTSGSVLVTGRQSCVQHLTVPESFVRHASDHSLVRADINLGWWYCNPNRALVINTSSGPDIVPSPYGQGDTIRIRNRGSIQWFYVPDGEVATYSIGTDQPKRVSVELYLPTDMTSPVSRYNITEGKGLPPRGRQYGQFSTNLYSIQGPFFIRVAGKARFTTVDYSLAVRKHDCATRERACLLQPAKPHFATLSGEGDLNPQHEAWFRFDVTGALTTGSSQRIDVAAQLTDSAVSAELIDYVDPSSSVALTSTVETSPPVHKWSGGAGTATSGYIRLHQARPGTAARRVSASMDSSIRFLTIKDLVCQDETNPEYGSDEIFTRITIDGVQRRVPASGTRAFDCDDSDDPRNWETEVGIPTIAFADKVEVRLYEEDDVSEDDASRLRELKPPPLGSDVLKNAPARWNFDGGRYVLSYETRRREIAPVADF